MSKIAVKLPVLKKMVNRLIKEVPVRYADKVDPLVRLVRAFLEYDCDSARAHSGEARIMSSIMDLNELRVTPAIELAATLGVRYPFVESLFACCIARSSRSLTANTTWVWRIWKT